MNNPSNVRYETPKIKKNQGEIRLSVDEEEFYFKYIEPFSEEVNAENRVVCKKIILISIFIILALLIFSISYQIWVIEVRKIPVVVWLGLCFLLQLLVMHKKIILISSVFIILSILISFISYQIGFIGVGKMHGVVFFGIVFCFLLKPLWIEKRDKHIRQYKNKLIPEMLNYLGCDYYSAKCSFEEELKIKYFCLTPYYSNLVTNFFLHSNYKNIAFTMLAAKQVRKSKNNNKITTVFEGLFFVFDTTKKFSSTTIVGRKGNRLPKGTKKMPQVILEDPEFNSLFSVYSDNQIESRTLLTPAFMCRLISLEKTLNSKIDCSFYSGELLIRVPTRWKYFSINGKNLRKDFKTIISEMQIVSEIIEGLKLDLDITSLNVENSR